MKNIQLNNGLEIPIIGSGATTFGKEGNAYAGALRGDTQEVDWAIEKFKNVIFDIDGTIIDTETAMLKALQKVLAQEGKEYALVDLRSVFGLPGRETLKHFKVADGEGAYLMWMETLAQFSQDIKVFEDMDKVIKQLSASSVKIGIVTSKTRQELVDGFNPFGLSPYFEYTISASDTQKNKPHPEPLLACLAGLNAAQAETIYIGDAIYDLQCAKSAGVKFGLALWGAKTTAGFESADFVLTEPNDILKLVSI